MLGTCVARGRGRIALLEGVGAWFPNMDAVRIWQGGGQKSFYQISKSECRSLCYGGSEACPLLPMRNFFEMQQFGASLYLVRILFRCTLAMGHFSDIFENILRLMRILNIKWLFSCRNNYII